MQSLVAILFLGVLCAVAYRLAYPSANRAYFLPALALKLAAGWAYGALYTYYYAQTGDSFNYFHDAGKLCALGRQDLGAYFRVVFLHEYAPIWDTTLQLWQEPRAFWFVKFVSLLMWGTGENYWVLSAYFSFFSFVGSWWLVETLNKHFPRTNKIALVAFLFFPSVVFFGSGLTKESLAIALLGVATALLLRRFAWHTLPALLACLYGLLELKFYYLALWAMSAFTCLLAYSIARRFALPAWGQVSLFASILVGGVAFASFLFDFDGLVLMIVFNHNSTYIHSHPHDLAHYSVHGGQGYISLDATWQSLLYNVPLALEAGFFRPYIWEANDKLKLVMSLENTFVLLLAAAAVGKTLWQGVRLTLFERLFACAVVFFVVGLLAIIALASPNLGSLVRYKVVVQGWILYGLGAMWIQKKNL